MPSVKTLLILIPALPLLATVFTAVLGAWALRQRSHWPSVLAIGASCVLSVMLVFQVQDDIQRQDHGKKSPSKASSQIGHEKTVTLWTWVLVEDAYPNNTASDDTSSETTPVASAARDFSVDISLRADPLTAIMLAMVTFISTVIAVYSIGYMHDDPGYWRFFTYIALFVFSMTMLVSVSNFVLLYVFWEAVGLCSYLLIGFWYEKPSAAAAGFKAFLVNRVGDFGFALGLFLLWTTYGTLNYHDTLAADGVTLQPGILGQTMLANPSLYVGGGLGMAICLLLLLGACGKSAQFPLHVWLPDAMEGPTPVSALIHAATMVTAGVYMIARCTPLYMASPEAQQTVAVVGGFTALLAALIALTQTDLKRILAYSTISQLGYMFLGLGAAAAFADVAAARADGAESSLGVVAGIFHLFTHAFFKALLFLGAGSVMHAMGGVIDVRQFGGLRRLMPITHATFLIGCLALAGIIPFAGFWSKDVILVAVDQQLHYGTNPALYQVLYYGALFTAFLTAFYTFRAYFLTFHGEERVPAEAGHHAHESPRVMTVPLVILAFCATVVGAYFELTHGFANFLEQTPSLAFLHGKMEPGELTKEFEFHWNVATLGTAVALSGVVLAVVLYFSSGPRLVNRLTAMMESLRLYTLSHSKFFFDEIYAALVVAPLRGLAWLSYRIDQVAIDGLVDGVGRAPKLIGHLLRPLQNGLVPFYALAMVLGLLVLFGSLML